MKHGGKNPILFLSLGVAALFLLGFLLLVTFGARSYRAIVDSQYNNMDGRALGAYLASSVKANDSRGSLSVESSAYGDVLVVTDTESGYAVRYYLYEGQLAEDLARVGSELYPEDAQMMGPTKVFKVERGENGLITVTTDAGRTLLYSRSGEEAAP